MNDKTSKTSADSGANKNYEEIFKHWLSTTPLKSTTQVFYTSVLKKAGVKFKDEIAPYNSIFEIDEVEDFKKVYNAIIKQADYASYNSAGHGTFAAALSQYEVFLKELQSNNVI